MGLGGPVRTAVQRRGVILPGYIGAMVVAAVLRLLDGRRHSARVALIMLRLWNLAALAAPILVLPAAQVVLCRAMCVTLTFRVVDRDYDAAVGAAGFCGFMLGVTANAATVMEGLCGKYGPAPRAFLVVPVAGAFLIDFTNSLVITAMANWLC